MVSLTDDNNQKKKDHKPILINILKVYNFVLRLKDSGSIMDHSEFRKNLLSTY